jgi:putative flippase GtrA
MRLLDRRDIVSALITGCTTGVIGWAVFGYLGRRFPWWAALIVPVLWLAGVQLGYALGVVAKPFSQFGKFCAIGFTNAAVDFGVLYLLIAATGVAAGVAYTLFKTVSFSVATLHSYLWNKYWAFGASRSHGGGREFASFIGVSLVSLLINVTIASIVVAFRPAGITPQAWAGISAVVGSAVALIFSFLGFRLFVFKK